MNWQRIDENTYIDDTLITCAEYQLFIDEMCEQGQYYQPDHWTSYQFQEGQAKEPILGIRPGDALVFCEWLSRKEEGKWHYRVPQLLEAENYQLHLSVELPKGYWVQEESGDYSFSWIKPAPNNPRMISEDIIVKSILDGLVSKGQGHIASAEAENLRLEQRIAKYLGTAFELDITQIAELAKARDPERDRVESIDRSIETILARDLDKRNTGGYASYIFSLVGDRILDYAYVGFENDLEKSTSLLIDSYTLKERIAGRSPAFEGIRLVKERIK